MELWNQTVSSELMPHWGYNVAVAVLVLNQIFGFTLNLGVIIFMCTDTQIWNPINIILFNLVSSDFGVSILGNPLALTSAYYHHWMFGSTGCQYYGFLMALFGINAITTMSALAFDRYFLVCRPFSAYKLSNRGAKIVVILIWLYSIAVTCPPLFGWSAFVPEAANISCSVNWEEKSFNSMTYIIYIFTFGLVVQMLLVVFSYANILFTMRESASKLNKTSASERKVTLMVLLMIANFIISWGPYAIFALFKQFGNGDIITPGMAVIPSIFAKTSIVYNPIIYVYMNSQFKVGMERIFCKKITPRIMTVSTAAALSERDDVRQTIRERLRTANKDDEPHIEHIEMQTLQPPNLAPAALADYDKVWQSVREPKIAKYNECRDKHEEKAVKILVEVKIEKTEEEISKD